jgi:hypothetical protein
VYSTSIFCHGALGKNEAIEHFPVGRRLAFDAAKGRLWVVCGACERWNLTPLDERWEAIEECERLFRDTRLRVSTEHVGLARLREGTTLVRIGDPQRPEMAAWRYGDQFHRRRRKHIAVTAAVIVAGGGYIVAGPMMGLLGGMSINLINLPNMLLAQRTVARVPAGGAVFRLNRTMLLNVLLRPDDAGGIELEVPHKRLTGWHRKLRRNPDQGRVVLRGDEALRAARHLLPRINRAGGGPKAVADAVTVLESSLDPATLFRRTALGSPTRDFRQDILAGFRRMRVGATISLASLPAAVRLAMEMSLHEEDERRALEGELSVLEDRWREAEEVAAISDDMFLPAGVSAMLNRLKGGS